jgi:hypothetical protein
MNTVDLLKYSVETAFGILGMVTADVTQEKADWPPPGKASSITANYAHILDYVDLVLQKILIPCDDALFQTYPIEEIILHEVETALPDLHQRAVEVRKAYQDWISSLTPEDLEVQMATTVGPLNVGQVVEVYVAWHINVHCGEISALKGLQGAQGYPW